VRRSSIVGILSNNSRLSPRCPHGELSMAITLTCSASPGFSSRGARSRTAVPFHTIAGVEASGCAITDGVPPFPCFQLWSSTRAMP